MSAQSELVPREVFDEDYQYFYEEILGPERSDLDAQFAAKLLNLKPGMRVLDVPCGDGRISGRLARRGCDVVGLDLTELYLARGRELYPEVTFERRDMRELPYEAEFDALIHWRAFGYFDPETNDAVLEGFARALRPGGVMLLEVHNPERLFKLIDFSGGAAVFLTERDDNLMLDKITYDETTRRSSTERIVVRDGAVQRMQYSIEHVPADEFEQRLLAAGFSAVERWSHEGEYERLGSRLALLATR